MHIPVLRDAVLENLLPPDHSVERVIDGTLGAGGHTAALLDAGAREVLGFDCDTMALDIARRNLSAYGERVHYAHASYAEMVHEAGRIGWGDGVDVILLDLGVSSMQLDTPERGFAFRAEGPLDMRFDAGGSRPTAADLVNTLDERELADLFFRYGEERDSHRLARAVVKQRPFATTSELASAIEKASPHRYDQKIHPATRVFQALRIAVNDELGTVEITLPQAINLLRPGGRFAVISFHSLEDRIVKDAFRLESTDCICPPKIPVCVCGHHASVRLVNRKPLVASEAEIAQNPRSRSAKLRVVEKL
jgi:16S rRNA (cytosine1402-N4)-methyltransferase